ncbi:MAG: immune inhibitor A [Caldilineaceae bacterium]|nr:immune inhibitor A [Caldilineaceae bacterium]
MGSIARNRRRRRFVLACLASTAVLLAACGNGLPVPETSSSVPAPCGVSGTEHAALPRVAELMDPEQAARVQATAAMLSDLPPPMDLAALMAATDPGLEDVPATLPDPLPTWTEGDETVFQVPHAETGEVRPVTAELVHASDLSYVWLEAGQPQRNRVRRLAARFNNELMMPLQEIFGTPPDDGFDQDPRVHILFAELEGPVAGFFSSRESISRVAVPESNEKEMLFIHANTLDDPDWAAQVVAHEYVHLVQWSNSPGEQEFIDEGLAELPPALGMFGEDYPGSLVRWSRNPRISLTSWSMDEADSELHYGAALGYAAWLTDTFGVDAARELLIHPDPGAVGVNGFLRDRGCRLSFDDTYADFSLAAFLGRPHLYGSGGALGIRSLVEAQDPVWAQARTARRLRPHWPVRDALRPHATRYLEVAGEELGTPETIVFQGAPQVAILPGLDPAQPVLWSGRWGDRHASLTMELDLTPLTPGSSVVLASRLWWVIEEGWDYAYVMVSRDGAEWSLLQSDFTTDTNPAGNNLGHGLTGDSGGWQAVDWDLGPWAGELVQLRISMVTDSADTQPGLVIGGLEVAETGWRLDPAVSRLAARLAGWLHVREPLAVTWLVQSVVVDPAAGAVRSVHRAVADADGLLELEPETWPAPNEKLFLLVSPLVPQVTIPIDYTMALRQR